MAKKIPYTMMYYPILVIMILSSLAGNAFALACENNVVFDGKGAGQVVFNVLAHTAKGISCSDCHEGRGFSFALFDMKKGADTISMRNMQFGYYCGSCHDGKKAFSVSDDLSCSKCHHK